MQQIILTEGQLNELRMLEIAKQRILNYIQQQKDEDPQYGVFRMIVRGLLTAGLAATQIYWLIHSIGIDPNIERQMQSVVQDETKQENVQNLNKNDKKQQQDWRVDFVRSYINGIVKLNGKNPESVKLSPNKIVSMCDKYGYDICLLLAQAHLESTFGTTARAQRTNSVFSIGAYDDGTDKVSYNTQDDSIEPYIKIMKRDYLKGKTLQDVFDNGLIHNTYNARYASNKRYEADLKSCYNRAARAYQTAKQNNLNNNKTYDISNSFR